MAQVQGADRLGQGVPGDTKDQILGDYLNAIYFGRGAYGIQAASQAYFGKDVQDLTPARARCWPG